MWPGMALLSQACKLWLHSNGFESRHELQGVKLCHAAHKWVCYQFLHKSGGSIQHSRFGPSKS